jgi:hypothetical protein
MTIAHDRLLESYRREKEMWRGRAELAEAKVIEWKLASSLEVNGDPDGVRPKHLVDALAAAEAQCAALREALEQVEYVAGDGDQGDDYCPWCIEPRWMGKHRDDCKRQLALAAEEITK